MSKYAKYGKVAKCGSPDSKYMSRPNALEEDIKRKISEASEFRERLRDLVLNSPGKLEFKYHYAIEIFLEIKKEFEL